MLLSGNTVRYYSIVAHASLQKEPHMKRMIFSAKCLHVRYKHFRLLQKVRALEEVRDSAEILLAPHEKEYIDKEIKATYEIMFKLG